MCVIFKRERAIIALCAVLLLAVSVGACSSTDTTHVVPETRYVVVDRPAPIPPGVLRYCWEEPMVVLEPNGPGLDVQGHWWSPAFTAVREVRQGRWRPCKPMLSEVKGETKNER